MSDTRAKPALQTALTPDQQQYFDLLGPPAIVDGEDEARYGRLLAGIVQTVQPVDVLEWIWVRDIVDQQWELLRYRSAKAEHINAAKHQPFIDLGIDLGEPSPTEPALIGRAISHIIPDLRRIDLMIESKEARRDKALREAERHRTTLGERLGRAAERVEQAEALETQPERKLRAA
jgi:hypothetical protein